MKPDNNPVPVYVTATGAAAEVGCLIITSVGVGVGLGLLLDHMLGTKHLFLFLFLLASIPINLWMIYRYILYKSRRLEASSRTQKEDSSSDD